MKRIHIAPFLITLSICSCDRSSPPEEEKANSNINSSINNLEIIHNDEIVPVRIKVSQHVATVLSVVSEEKDMSLDSLFQMFGIFCHGSSLKIVDGNIVTGKIAKSERDILEQCLRLMEAEGDKLTKHSLLEDEPNF